MVRDDAKSGGLGDLQKPIIYTVSALFEPRGSIFQNGFLGGVLSTFDLPGVVIETAFY